MFVWLTGSKLVSLCIMQLFTCMFNSCNLHDTLILNSSWVINFIESWLCQNVIQYTRFLILEIFCRTVTVVQSTFDEIDMYVTGLVQTCTYFFIFTVTCDTSLTKFTCVTYFPFEESSLRLCWLKIVNLTSRRFREKMRPNVLFSALSQFY